MYTYVLFQTIQDNRHLYPSYHSLYQFINDNNEYHFSHFIFDSEVTVNQEVPVSGIMAIGMNVAYESSLDYMLMDYSDMQAMALRAGVEPVKSAYVIFCDNIDALYELEDYIVKKELFLLSAAKSHRKSGALQPIVRGKSRCFFS